MIEKLGRDDGTDRVTAKVRGTRVAAAVSKEAGDRIAAAWGKRSAQNIEVSHSAGRRVSARGRGRRKPGRALEGVDLISAWKKQKAVADRWRGEVVR